MYSKYVLHLGFNYFSLCWDKMPNTQIQRGKVCSGSVGRVQSTVSCLQAGWHREGHRRGDTVMAGQGRQEAHSSEGRAGSSAPLSIWATTTAGMGHPESQPNSAFQMPRSMPAWGFGDFWIHAMPTLTEFWPLVLHTGGDWTARLQGSTAGPLFPWFSLISQASKSTRHGRISSSSLCFPLFQFVVLWIFIGEVQWVHLKPCLVVWAMLLLLPESE